MSWRMGVSCVCGVHFSAGGCVSVCAYVCICVDMRTYVSICALLCTCASYMGVHMCAHVHIVPYVGGQFWNLPGRGAPADEPSDEGFVCAVYTFRLVVV